MGEERGVYGVLVGKPEEKRKWGHAVAQWLRHCATNRNVAGSIPDAVRIFHRHNPSGRTMALESTQPLTEMSTRNILGVKAAGA
jgi:hypothetical protein